MEMQSPRPTVKTDASAFVGDVYMTPVYNGTGPSRMTVARVRFTPSARTNWHSHAVGQTLHVSEGVGLVGIGDGSVFRVRAGDTVVCPPGEEHWHGAAANTFMSQFALLEANPEGSDPTTWLEPLTDDGATPRSSSDRHFCTIEQSETLMTDQSSQPR